MLNLRLKSLISKDECYVQLETEKGGRGGEKRERNQSAWRCGDDEEEKLLGSTMITSI